MSCQAEIERELGNGAYRRQNYSAALFHYNKAIELNPTNITYYTNKAAVLLEQQKFDECIQVSLEGIDVGRKHQADACSLAKAYGRIGNAYYKQNKYQEAEKYYAKSLEEYVDPEVLVKHDQVQQLSSSTNNSKQLGDQHYKSGNFEQAVNYYTAAINRSPNDAKLYGNRSQCYLKLSKNDLALRDAEECIRLDPNFIKGHLRKGYACLQLKEYNCALLAFKSALKLDKNCQEAIVGYQTACNYISSHPEYGVQDQDLFTTLSEEFDDGLESLSQFSKKAWNSLTQSSKESGAKLKKLFTGGKASKK